MISQISNNNYDSLFIGKKPLADTLCPTLFHYALDHRIENLQGRIAKNSAYKLDKKEIEDLKKAFDISRFSSYLKDLVGKIPAENIQSLIVDGLKDSTTLDPWVTAALHRLSEEKLTEICKIGHELKIAKGTQKELKEDALRSVLETRSLAILSELSTEMFYFVDHTLNLFIEALGLRQIGASPSNRYGGRGGSGSEAKSRLEAYLAILLYPTVIFGYLVSKLEHMPSAFLLTVLISMGSVLFLICYDRFIKPCPKQCSGLINLNLKVKRGTDDPIYHRPDILNKIENAFAQGKGVLLHGKTGTGKTAIVRALAERIVQNKCSDLIKGTQIFEATAGSFGKFNEDSVSFSTIRDTFDRHEKDIIPFLDEIHSAFKNDKGSLSVDVVDDLKKFFDSFPHIIAATTTEEYEKYVKKEIAFMRRFEVIEVMPFSPEEIQITLFKTLHWRHPELRAEQEDIAYICDQAQKYLPDTSHIDAARSLLFRAMFKATHLTFDTLEKEINELSLKNELQSNKLMHQTATVCSEEYTDNCAKLKKLENELAGKKQQLNRLKKLEKVYRGVWQKGFKLAEQAEKDSSKQREWLENQALVQLMQQAIQKYKEELGLPVSLNRKLIDEILKEKN